MAQEPRRGRRRESISNENARLPGGRSLRDGYAPGYSETGRIHGVVGTLRLAAGRSPGFICRIHFEPSRGGLPSALNPIPTLALRRLSDQNDDFTVGILTGRLHRHRGHVPAGELKEVAENSQVAIGTSRRGSWTVG